MTSLSVVLVLCVTIIHSATSHPAHTELEAFNNLSIVGGHNVSIEDARFLVGLKIKHVRNRWRHCAGSIIHEQFVLTAAHCCYNYIKIKVSVGSSKWFDGEVYEAANASVHELFNWNSYHDVCVVKLNRVLTFGPRVGKISLADDAMRLEDGTYFNTLGWGRTVIDNPSSKSSYLQEVSVSLVSKCQEKIKRVIMSRTILCAGSKNGTIAKMMGKVTAQGLVSDLMPNIKLMQAAGHFLFNYHSENGSMSVLLRKVYASTHAVLIFIHFVCIAINMAQYADEVNELTANTITVLFFAHSLMKLAFFALNSKNFYRTLAVWNQSNSHPLFSESDARYHQLALNKMRKLLYFICIITVVSVISWVTLTFFGESVRMITNKETNETLTEPAPRLPLKAWYPFNAMSGPMYIIAFVVQVYWLLFSMSIANLLDVMFCSWLIFACEQLQHLKAIMKPLMELSAALDTYRPNTAELFRASSTEKSEKMHESTDLDIRGIYSTQQDFGMTLRGAGGRLQSFGQNAPNNPNGLSQKQEMLARSAIKYWVERHKHVVRLVSSIGDTYGTALLFHMLVSTITLTLLAYQATKIDGINVYAFSTIGYLSYTLGQVFHFCIFGNRLIEESSSVMEAAYSCQWYDGSEEAKTFVQIVCQQCQKAMSISGAKFFTVSLDLFASVLGAVVTYFMVLVQLK